VYSAKTPDDGQRNYPKHVEFHSKNKSEKLAHLVGFVIYEFISDAWSHERSNCILVSKTSPCRWPDYWPKLVAEDINKNTL
jgi:hypothetical protein